MSTAISIVDVSKKYRLYHERNQALKVAILRGRRARYEEFWALRDVSFDIEQGSTFGLIGENGSGKSTLLKCMANILRADKGSIVVAGKLSALLELGAGFHPELSGRENVFLNGAILGLSKKQITERFDEIIEFAGLERFVDSPVKNYSSGMYLRLGFSVAINVDPDVLLIDEILAVGDAEFQQRCAQKFVDLKERGKTIIIVSHALDTIRNFCDEAVLLHHGRVQTIGPAATVVDEYLEGVHIDRQVDVHGPRSGSGEIRVERVSLLDASGKSTTRVRTGDAMTVRLEFVATEPVERPVFGLGIARIDGAEVTGPNTRDAEIVPDKIEGRGHVDYRIDRCLLLPGTYDVSVAIFDYTISQPFDARNRALRFDVEHGTPFQRHGIITLDGSWDIVEDAPSS